MELYFPFADGALGYDCVRCGSRCCHGLGFGVARSQLVPLLAKRPQLAPFLQPMGSYASAMDLTDEGCWFLQPGGRCGIEVEEGRGAKPSVCRLFPFTRLHRIGALTVVEPHLLLCPLEDARGAGVRHGELAAEVDAGGGELPLMSTAAPAGLPDDWAARERALIERLGGLLDARDPLALAVAQAGSVDPGERLAALRVAWRTSLALDEVETLRWEGETARPLALLVPTLRFGTLFSLGAGPYPKVAARLPQLLLALSLIAGLAARALGRSPSLRSIGELFRATAFERELLVRWDRPVALAGALRPSVLPPPADGALERLGQLLEAGAPRLGDAFDAATGDLAPELRPLVIRALSDRYGALRFS